MRYIKILSAFSLLCLALNNPGAFAQSSDYVPVTDDILQNPAPEDWMMWRRTLNGWGYSPLDEINKENVANLELVWSADLEEGIQEGTPLIYNGIMEMHRNFRSRG